jgi:hypothetical protein
LIGTVIVATLVATFLLAGFLPALAILAITFEVMVG